MTALRRSVQSWLGAFRKDQSGSVFIEAALVLPLTAIVLAAIAEWGLTMYEYHRLSLATGAAVRQLVANRGFPSPYSNVLTQYATWADTLKVNSSQIAVSIQKSDGSFGTCNSDSACTTLLDAAQGRGAKIEVTYTCDLAFTPQRASPCPLKIAMVGLVD